MFYKIDTKEQFDVIIPIVTQLSQEMSDELVQIATQICNNGRDALLDLSSLEQAADEWTRLITNIASIYSEAQLCFVVFLKNVAMRNMLQSQVTCVYTLEEGIDWISMEILARDLLREEGEEEL